MTTYRVSGVDQAAADALVPFFAAQAERTRSSPVEAPGGFAGLFPLGEVLHRYRDPVLASSTDTVGTKVELLRREGRDATAGWDCVAMNVDDVVCCGAEPLFFVDCITIDRLDPAIVKAIVTGVADACVEAGCQLVGGETAQLPGLLAPGGYEVMGTCVGVAEREELWGPHRVKVGDAIVGLASSGPHANGFSLLRRLLAEASPIPPAEQLLAPTAIYTPALLEAGRRAEIHAAAHVTGGGIAGNLARALPAGIGAQVDTAAWPHPDVYRWVAERGVSPEELWGTFNLGIGMLVVAPDGEMLVEVLREAGARAWVVGETVAEPGVALVSSSDAE